MLPLSAQERQAMAQTVELARLPNPLEIRMADRDTHQVFSPISGARTLRGPGLSALRQDVTEHNGSGWQELAAVLKTGSQVRLDLIFTDAHEALLQASLDQTVEDFRLALSENLALQFSALVSLEFQAAPGSALQAEATLTLSGPASLL